MFVCDRQLSFLSNAGIIRLAQSAALSGRHLLVTSSQKTWEFLEPCENVETDRNAVFVVDCGGPKEPRIRWGSRYPIRKGNFEEGKRRPIVKYRDTLPSAVHAKTAEPIEMPFGTPN